MVDQVDHRYVRGNDEAVAERYAYQEARPYSLGWWTEFGGVEPPVEVQCPAGSEPVGERAVRVDVPRLDERPGVVTPNPLPWPVPGAPFALLDVREYLGTYVASYLRDEVGPWDMRVDPVAFDRQSRHGPARTSMLPGAAVHWLGLWHSIRVEGGGHLTSTLAWVTRVLSIVLWSVQPRVDATLASLGVVDGQAPSDVLRARFGSRFIVVPGGNLHALICLAWYAMADAAGPLLEAFAACPKRLPAEPGRLGVDARLRGALAGLGAVPGHPLGGWSSAPGSLVEPYPEFAWGARRAAQVAHDHGASLRSLELLATGRSKDRGRVPSSLAGRVRAAQWDDLARRNLHVYSDFCRRLLRATVESLRVMNHVVYRACAFYSHGALWDPRESPHAYCTALENLRQAPLHNLHLGCAQFADLCLLPRALLLHLEADLQRHVAAVGPIALHQYWGVPPGRPDSVDRAGALCPGGAFYWRFGSPPDRGADGA